VTDRRLGMTWFSGNGQTAVEERPKPKVNTRNSLWRDRWPAIALDSCIELVEGAPPDQQGTVKANLPCHTCPEKSRCLNAKRKDIGSLMFDREILTRPRASESTFFPRELMEPMLNKASALQMTYRKPEGLETSYAVGQAWDLAWSERTGGDYLVCMTAVVDLARGVSRLLQIERWQKVPFDEQCKLIEHKWRQYGAQFVVIESDAAQTIWAQHVAATTPVPVIRHDSSGKRDLAHGVPSMLIQFQNRKWEFPYTEGSWCQEEVDNLLTELEAFGWVNGKLEGVGEHDDTVMCLWHLNWAIQRLLLGAAPQEGHAGMVAGRTA
jgi:hypothetical protein